MVKNVVRSFRAVGELFTALFLISFAGKAVKRLVKWLIGSLSRFSPVPDFFSRGVVFSQKTGFFVKDSFFA